jgi:hypothetical protein
LLRAVVSGPQLPLLLLLAFIWLGDGFDGLIWSPLALRVLRLWLSLLIVKFRLSLRALLLPVISPFFDLPLSFLQLFSPTSILFSTIIEVFQLLSRHLMPLSLPFSRHMLFASLFAATSLPNYFSLRLFSRFQPF